MNEPRDTVLNKINWTHENTAWFHLCVECLRKKVKLKYGDWDESMSEGGLGKEVKILEYVWWTNLEI